MLRRRSCNQSREKQKAKKVGGRGGRKFRAPKRGGGVEKKKCGSRGGGEGGCVYRETMKNPDRNKKRIDGKEESLIIVLGCVEDQ